MKKILGLLLICATAYGAALTTPPGIQLGGTATNGNILVYTNGFVIDSGVQPTNVVITNYNARITTLEANSIASNVWATVSNNAYTALQPSDIGDTVAGVITNVYTIDNLATPVRNFDFNANGSWVECPVIKLSSVEQTGITELNASYFAYYMDASNDRITVSTPTNATAIRFEGYVSTNSMTAYDGAMIAAVIFYTNPSGSFGVQTSPKYEMVANTNNWFSYITPFGSSALAGSHPLAHVYHYGTTGASTITNVVPYWITHIEAYIPPSQSDEVLGTFIKDAQGETW